MNHLVVVGGTAVSQPLAHLAYSVYGRLISSKLTITSIPAWGFEQAKAYGLIPAIVHMVPGLGHPQEAFEKIEQKIFREAGDNPIDIIGHSQGGFEAINLAYRYPDRVRNAITLATPHNGTEVAWLARKFAPAQAIKAMSPSSRFIDQHKSRLCELSELNGGPKVTSIFTYEDGLVPYDSACLSMLGFESENFFDCIVCSESDFLKLRSKGNLPGSVRLLEDDWQTMGKIFAWPGQVVCHAAIIWQASVLSEVKSTLNYLDDTDYLSSLKIVS